MKNKTLVIIFFIVALLGVVKFFFLQKDDGNTTQSAAQKSQSANVAGFVVHAQQMESSIFSSGTIYANEEVELRSETAGKIISILFKEGTTVNKGDLLVKMNDADLQAQLKKSEIQLKLAKEKETRLRSLLEIKGVSQEEYDETANQLQTIDADMDYTRAQIAKTEIRAPFSGKIGLRKVSEGNFVNSTNVIATIQQTDLLKLDLAIPEKYAAAIAVGDTVKFSVEGVKEKLMAFVWAIEPKIDDQTRNVTIRAMYKNTLGNIYPGAFVKAQLVVTKKQFGFMIPTEAVIPELKGKKVFVCKNGKATSSKIETGVRTDTQVEVTSGLNAGDTVIVSGIMSLKPDAPVKITNLKN